MTEKGVKEVTNSKTAFLPKYSKLYFEQKKAWSALWLMVIIYAGIFLIPILMAVSEEEEDVGAFGVFSILVYICVLFYHLALRKRVWEVKKEYGMSFATDGVKRIGLHGEEETIPYAVYEEAVSAGEFRYEKTGLVIGKGIHELVFHYEIGNSEAQKDVKQCYATLQEHITGKLPPFETKCLGLLDKRYFYKKSMRNQSISLLCATLFMLVVKSSLMEMMMFGIIVLCPWECISFYIIVKNAYMISQNNTALQKLVQDYENVRMGSPYEGYFYMVAVIALFVWINTMIIF